MPTAEQHQFFIQFVAGLNTEATPLNFPENTAQVLDNFDLSPTGEISRRLGVEFEDSYLIRPETTPANEIDTYAVSTHEWKAVNGKGDINFLVVQIGVKLFFHDLGAEPVSGNIRGTLDLGSHKTGEAPEIHVMDSAFGEGIMMIGNEGMNTVIIEFDEDTETFSDTAVVMEIRDFDAIDEPGVEADFRPKVLTPDHKYNLRNNGWPLQATVNRNQRGSRGVLLKQDPIDFTALMTGNPPDNAQAESPEEALEIQQAGPDPGTYPSLANIFHAAKAAAADDAEVIGSYSPFELEKLALGNTPAPNGHFILNLFSKDRTGVSNITGLSTGLEFTDKRPSVVAFYAGRVWYAGIPDKNFTGDIYFSQSLTDIENAGKCFQEQDPTAEDLNALLATDGGRIHIADMGRVYGAKQLGQDLIFISSTGVYAISGSSGGNFQADDFTVRKITDQGAIGKESIIEAEGSLFWWAEGGIWNMSGSQITEELQVNRITKDTIQTLYDDIKPGPRAYVRGFYDNFAKKIYWFFNDTNTYDAINFRFSYNRALVLDLTLGAFYTYTIQDIDVDTPFIAGMTQKTPGSESIIAYNVVQGTDNVIQGGDNVVQDIAFEIFADVKLKLLTFVENVDGTYSYTFSEFKSREFVDWEAWDLVKNGPFSTGANYNSVIQTGWNDLGDPIRSKYISHVTSFFNVTEDGYELDDDLDIIFSNQSGATIQVRWEYTDTDVGKWTAKHQAYRLFRAFIPEDVNDPFDYGYLIVRNKLRMRGQGHAFSIRYESVPGKDMQLIGFAVNVKAPVKV